jgi:hypothetical protein
MHSPDGTTWEELREGLPGHVTDAAGGPDGWVAIAYHGYGGTMVSHSADGRTWDEPQGLTGSQHAVAHGGAGWVLIGYDYDAGLYARRSVDGRTWADAVTVPGEGSQPELEASDAGYVAFDRYSGLAVGSIDGEQWQPLDIPQAPGWWIADVELVGREVWAITVDHETEGTTVHRGTLEADSSVTWTGTVDSDQFGNHRVDSISSGADGLIALGWDPDALVPTAWASRDGTSWAGLDIGPTVFGGVVGPEPVWGSGGWIGLGQDGGRDALWRSTDGSSWATSARVATRETAEPPCPAAADVTTLDLMLLGDRAYDCFGDEPLTIRGWVPLVEGLGGCCYPEAEPQWLAGPYPSSWLTAGESDALALFAGLKLYVPPTVDGSALDVHTWVDLAGHYGDPAAGTCRSAPVASFPTRLESQDLIREGCARRFVVDRVSPISAR